MLKPVQMLRSRILSPLGAPRHSLHMPSTLGEDPATVETRCLVAFAPCAKAVDKRRPSTNTNKRSAPLKTSFAPRGTIHYILQDSILW